MMNSPRTFTLIAAGVLLTGITSLFASETDVRIESAFGKSYANRILMKDDAIRTESKDGVVTLTGQVSELSHKYLAQETVASIQGVLKVDNQLIIKLEGAEESDSWIKAKVRSVLTFHRNVNGSKTEVDVKDGVVTLRGVATSEAQKDLTGEYAGDVKGVLRVTNVMTIGIVAASTDDSTAAVIDDASINAEVRVALQSHHSTSAITTKVSTLNGVVTVSGNAKNANEKTLVSKLADDISGVKSVVNNMTVDAAPAPNPANVSGK